MVRSYRELEVWQRAMELAVEGYRLSAAFPREELYGLTAQLRRAASSIPANIAEGQGRRTTKDFIRFLGFAYGSLMELETHVQLAQALGFCDPPSVGHILASSSEVGRMLNGLRNSLIAKSQASEAPVPDPPTD